MPTTGTQHRSPLWPYLLFPAALALMVASGPLYSWYSLIEHFEAQDRVNA